MRQQGRVGASMPRRRFAQVDECGLSQHCQSLHSLGHLRAPHLADRCKRRPTAQTTLPVRQYQFVWVYSQYLHLQAHNSPPIPFSLMYTSSHQQMNKSKKTYDLLDQPSALPDATPGATKDVHQTPSTPCNLPKGEDTPVILSFDLTRQRIEPKALVRHINQFSVRAGTMIGSHTSPL